MEYYKNAKIIKNLEDLPKINSKHNFYDAICYQVALKSIKDGFAIYDAYYTETNNLENAFDGFDTFRFSYALKL